MATVEKKRGWLLTTWLILMLIGNAATAISYFFFGSFITAALPAIPSWVIYFLGIISLLNILFTIFLLKWKKWAFFAFCGMAGIVFVINVFSLGFGIFQIAGLLGSVILYLLLSPKWKYLE